jgi:hypothetical protein
MMVTAYVTAVAAAPSMDDEGAELGVNEDSQGAVDDAVEAALDDQEGEESHHYRRRHHRHHHHHRRPNYYGRGLRFRRSAAIDEDTDDALFVDAPIAPSQDDLEEEASRHRHHGHRRHHHHHRHHDYRRQGYYGRQRY